MHAEGFLAGFGKVGCSMRTSPAGILLAEVSRNTRASFKGAICSVKSPEKLLAKGALKPIPGGGREGTP